MIPIRHPWTRQPHGAVRVGQALGAPVFTFAGRVDLTLGAGALNGSSPRYAASPLGYGFDSSGAAGDRLTWPYAASHGLTGPEPICILWAFDGAGYYSTGGTVNLSLSRRTTAGATGEWYLANTDAGELALTYRRVGGAQVQYQWSAGALPTSGRTVLLLVREQTDSATAAWRLYANGADKGAVNETGGLVSNQMEGGGSQGLEIGSSGSLATRGVKCVTSLVHISRGVIPPAGLAKDITRNPWGIFAPIERRIWLPVSAAGGAHSGAVAESASASDSPAAAAAWIAAIAEATTAAELTAALLAMVAAASESGSVADEADALRALIAAASDSATAADESAASLGSGHSGAVAEAGSAADAAVAVAALLAASSETVGVSDAAAAIAALLAAVAEAGSAADVADWVAGASHSGAVSEAGAIAEAAAAAAALVGAVHDTSIVDDLAAAIADYRAALAEATQPQDVVAAIGALVGVWPDPATVLAGVAYGPTGADYTGTLQLLTAAQVWAYVSRTLTGTVPANVKQVNDVTIAGSGVPGSDPWRPAP